MITSPDWTTFHSAAELEQAAVSRILASAQAAIAARQAFSLVLAGGTTPRRVYEALRQTQADWAHWHIYFGDERCLPVEHADRNSRMAGEAWLDHVAIPPAQIHIIQAHLGAEIASRKYALSLENIPEFDMVLLGLGEDGHTASLFPDHDLGECVDTPDALAVFNAPKPPSERVSLSAYRLSRAQTVLFLVTGVGKRDALAAWRAGKPIPASRISALKQLEVLLAV